MEDDVPHGRKHRHGVDFNPRPPCGGRPAVAVASPVAASFQSTSSVWRTTIFNHINVAHAQISIHVLRVEDDQDTARGWGGQCIFQSTSSVWRTTLAKIPRLASRPISIHVLRVEDDNRCIPWATLCSDFNPRPPCGGRRGASKRPVLTPQFQSTSSVWRTTASNVWCFADCVISIHVLRVEDDFRFIAALV